MGDGAPFRIPNIPKSAGLESFGGYLQREAEEV